MLRRRSTIVKSLNRILGCLKVACNPQESLQHTNSHKFVLQLTVTVGKASKTGCCFQKSTVLCICVGCVGLFDLKCLSFLWMHLKQLKHLLRDSWLLVDILGLLGGKHCVVQRLPTTELQVFCILSVTHNLVTNTSSGGCNYISSHRKGLHQVVKVNVATKYHFQTFSKLITIWAFMFTMTTNSVYKSGVWCNMCSDVQRLQYIK